MSDTVTVRTECLRQIAADLEGVSSRLHSASLPTGSFEYPVRSGEPHLHGASVHHGSLNETLASYRSAISQLSDRSAALARGTRKAATIFEETEGELAKCDPRELTRELLEKLAELARLPSKLASLAYASTIGAWRERAEAARRERELEHQRRFSSVKEQLDLISADGRDSFRQNTNEAMYELSMKTAYSLDETGAYDDTLLKELGFENSFSTTFPEAVVAYRTNSNGEPVVMVLFEGTQSGADWGHNFDFSPDKAGIHSGFGSETQKFYEAACKQSITGMGEYKTFGDLMQGATSGKPVNFVIAGHSLGGAESQVLTHKLLQSGVPTTSVTTYTYASPKPFTAEAASAVSSSAQVYNIINSRDLVPSVGCSAVLGENIGTDYRFTGDSLSAESYSGSLSGNVSYLKDSVVYNHMGAYDGIVYTQMRSLSSTDGYSGGSSSGGGGFGGGGGGGSF